MNDVIQKLVDVYTDPGMTKEGRASVLGYARGRLDAQREMGDAKSSSAELEEGRGEGPQKCKN